MDMEKKLLKLDVLVLGDMAVGKTSMISRFMFETHEKSYFPTFGIDFLTKMIYRTEHVLRVQFWDSAGRRCFDALLPSYVRDSRLTMVVYDVSKRSSFERAQELVEQVQKQHGKDVYILLVGNKCDVSSSERQVLERDGQAKAEAMGVAHCETSAQSAIGVKGAFERMLKAGVKSLTNESMKEQEEQAAAELRQRQEAEVADLVLPSPPEVDSCGCSVVWSALASMLKTTFYGGEIGQQEPRQQEC